MNHIAKNLWEISIQDVIKIYKTKSVEVVALRGLSCVLKCGEISVIMGPSGSGKTTLLNILGGVDRVTTGKIILKDEDLTKYTSPELEDYRRKDIGYIFQNFNLIPSLNVLENILITLNLNNIFGKEAEQKVDELFTLIGLEERKNHYPDELSGGEQQRVAIASALAHDPEILICDEPTGELDSTSKRKIMDLLKKIIEENPNKIIIVVTHDQDFRMIADHLLIIKDGKISYEYSPEQLQQIHNQDLGNGEFYQKKQYSPLSEPDIKNAKLEELLELDHIIKDKIKMIKK